MQIARDRMLSILEAMKPGLARKEILEESGNFIFDNDRILTYNDQVCIIHPLNCDFRCSVPAEELHKLIKLIGDDTLVLTLGESGAMLKIKTRSTNIELAALTGDPITELVSNFPDMEPWLRVPEKMMEGIKWCSFSAAKNATLTYLTGIHIGNRYIMATDELRISKYTLPAKMRATLLIPADSARQLLAFTPISYSVKDGWCFFKNDADVVFCTRTIEGEYPVRNYMREFNFEGVDVALPASLKGALEVSQVLADGQIPEEKRVDITIKQGVLTIKAQKRDVGNIRKRMKVRYNNSRAITFTINPIHLHAILDRTRNMKIGQDRALFKTGGFEHLVSLFVEE